MTGTAGGENPGRLRWQDDSTGATCDLSGHFWATVSAARPGAQAVWSWMIIGYGNEVMAAGQTGDPSAAKLLIEARDQWVTGPEADLDEAGNPVPVADDCTTYQPVWPSWPDAAH
jgi:hypothetical protein